MQSHDFPLCWRCPAGGLDLRKLRFHFLLMLPCGRPRSWKITVLWFIQFSSRCKTRIFSWIWASGVCCMLKVLVLKNAVECTSQRLKWTSGARVMIIVYAWFAVSWWARELVSQWAGELWLPDCESSIGVTVFHGVHPPLAPPATLWYKNAP